MLTRLTIENFQAHRELTVELDPKLTVLTGPSDVGKSAIIRALTWVVLGEPDGDSFIRHGAKQARVRLTVGKRVILRERGKGANRYELDRDEFKAFGKDVPPEVRELLQMTELNFQLQHDSPFWFSESSGEVSRQINAIVNLGAIDAVQAEVSRRVRESRNNVEVATQKLRDSKAELERLAAFGPVDAALRLVEEKESVLAAVATKRSDLALELAALVEAGNTLSTIRRSLERGEVLLRKAQQAEALRQQWFELFTDLDRLNSTRKQASVKVPSTTALQQTREAALSSSQARSVLAGDIETLRELWKARKAADSALSVASTALALRTKGERCPLCGGALDSDEHTNRHSVQ